MTRTVKAVKECEREAQNRWRTEKEMEMKVVRVSGNGQQVKKVPHICPIVAIRTYCLKESMLDIFPLLIISTGTNDRWGRRTRELWMLSSTWISSQILMLKQSKLAPGQNKVMPIELEVRHFFFFFSILTCKRCVPDFGGGSSLIMR